MQLPVLIAKFTLGGLLVCAFALISEVFTPKRFAGLFSAAPSVLVAGLAVTLLAMSADKAALTAQGAIAGAVGMIAYCLACTSLIRRFKALGGASLALLLWGAVSFAAYGLLGKVVGW